MKKVKYNIVQGRIDKYLVTLTKENEIYLIEDPDFYFEGQLLFDLSDGIFLNDLKDKNLVKKIEAQFLNKEG